MWQQQRKKSSEQLAQSLSFQYHAEDGTWNVEYIHGLGMYALKDGYLIRLSDAEGQVIWDAENHDMTLCHQIMPGYPYTDGGKTTRVRWEF